MYMAAVVFLVIMPNAQSGWVSVAIAGAVLGMAAYGTYDMTNYSVFKGFSAKAAFADWAWGAVVTASASLGGYAAMQFMGK